jgi:hypothetical protein
MSTFVKTFLNMADFSYKLFGFKCPEQKSYDIFNCCNFVAKWTTAYGTSSDSQASGEILLITYLFAFPRLPIPYVQKLNIGDKFPH